MVRITTDGADGSSLVAVLLQTLRFGATDSRRSPEHARGRLGKLGVHSRALAQATSSKLDRAAVIMAPSYETGGSDTRARLDDRRRPRCIGEPCTDLGRSKRSFR